MRCAAIITNAPQFKKPVQSLALFFAQLSRFDESLMNRSYNSAVFTQLQAFTQ